MSKASRGNPFLAEMTEGQEVDAVFNGHAERKVSEGLPEGLDTLRNAYQEFWAETHHQPQIPISDDSEHENSIETIEPEAERLHESFKGQEDRAAESKPAVLKPRIPTKAKVSSRRGRQRFGLPEGFVPRMQRFGRGVLLEWNIYSLPNGQEFIPCLPTGPLGSRHLYALLTGEQYLRGGRGSVYVRGDGKIFDYSEVSVNQLGDMFDTGYTIYDLQRTGRYVPSAESTREIAEAEGRLKRSGKNKAQPKESRPLSSQAVRHRKLPKDTRARHMIRKLKSGKYRLYSRKNDPKTGKRKNLGTFETREAAEKHEREVQYFKRH